MHIFNNKNRPEGGGYLYFAVNADLALYRTGSNGLDQPFLAFQAYGYSKKGDDNEQYQDQSEKTYGAQQQKAYRFGKRHGFFPIMNAI